MQNYEEIIINYIENCDLTDNEKAIFISLLSAVVKYCREHRDSQNPKTVKQLSLAGEWDEIDKNHKKTLGKYVCHIVKIGGLPLTDTGKKTSSNHRLYTIKK